MNPQHSVDPSQPPSQSTIVLRIEDIDDELRDPSLSTNVRMAHATARMEPQPSLSAYRLFTDQELRVAALCAALPSERDNLHEVIAKRHALAAAVGRPPVTQKPVCFGHEALAALLSPAELAAATTIQLQAHQASVVDEWSQWLGEVDGPGAPFDEWYAESYPHGPRGAR